MIANIIKLLKLEVKVLLLGPIEVFNTESWDIYLMWLRRIDVYIKEPIIFLNNQIAGIIFFKACEVTLSGKITFKLNICTGILDHGTSFMKVIEQSVISFINNVVYNEFIARENSHNVPQPFCISVQQIK